MIRQVVDSIKSVFRKKNNPGDCLMVLMYHRVKDLDTDPWDLGVGVHNFELQIQELIKHFNVISYGEASSQLANNKPFLPKTVLVTFDDAYSDNYYNARPILVRNNCPATFFIPSAFIGSEKYFWWDELEQIILHADTLPVTLTLIINKQAIQFNLQSAQLTLNEKTQQQKWRWPDDPPNDRCVLYLKIWELLKPLPHTEIEEVLQQIKTWAGYEWKKDTYSIPMNVDQLREIADHPLFTLGIHTHTHPALSFHDSASQQREIVQCSNFLQEKFSVKAGCIAYPYGDFNEQTIELAGNTGLETGFTTNPEMVTKQTNPLCMGRYQVLNWNGDEFHMHLKTWGDGR